MGRGSSKAGGGGARGQSQSAMIAKIDDAAEKLYELQRRNDRLVPNGRDFFDRTTGKDVPRETVVELRNDLKKANRRFEQLLKKAKVPQYVKDVAQMIAEGSDLPF